jgi:hypothetical protein
MYIVNDINYLLFLAKLLKVHELLPPGSIAISRMKTHQHNAVTKQQLNGFKQIVHLNIDDVELFENWRKLKSRGLSGGDLSTIYIAVKNPKLTILLSEEDLFLPDVCNHCNVRYKQWDELIQEIADGRMIEMYKLFKAS